MIEVPLDGPDARVQGVGDLPVGATGRGESRHPLFGFRQRAEDGSTSSDPGELRPALLRPEPGTEHLEDPERLLERLPGGPFLAGAATHATLDQERRPSSNGIVKRS